MLRRLACVLLILFLLSPTTAAAHQRLLGSEPSAGSALAEAPGTIRLTFNEPVNPALARLSLLGPAGEVPLAGVDVPADAPRTLVARVSGELPAGTYTVEWQVTGSDGHPVRDRFTFSVVPAAAGPSPAPAPGPAGAADPSAPAGPPAPDAAAGEPAFAAESPLYAAVRWLTFVGLVVVIGAAAFALLVLPRLRRRAPWLEVESISRARLRAAATGLVAAGILVVALLLRLYAQSVALGATGAASGLIGSMLARTYWGWGWLLQAAATLLALAGFGLARRGRGGGWALAGLASLALAVTPALSGHAVATSAAAVAADALHVLGAGGWLGSLLLVLVAGLPALLRQSATRARSAAALLGAFTPVALTFAGVVTLTGVYSAWLHVGEASALWTSPYGRTLLLKLAVVAVVFAAGLLNWLRVGRSVGRHGDARWLRRSAAVEIAAAMVVLGVTSALVATPPPAHRLHGSPLTEAEPAVAPATVPRP